jgi:glutamate-1-semialdehyde aminotransferase/spore coat polysaccharide biosynthesis protein SpsF (cytidylyltransferase family)
MILAVLQARCSSSRLPGKVLMPILGRPMFALQLERLGRCRTIDRLVVATSVDPSDDAIERLCLSLGVACFRGSMDDVLDRFYRAASSYAPRHVVRLTGDCPLADPEAIDDLVRAYLAGDHDYASNSLEPTLPDGLDAEVFRFESLEQAAREAVLPSQREHVTLFINRQPGRFRVLSYKSAHDLSHLRWTVDEPADFELVSEIYRSLYPGNPAFTTGDVLALLEERPELKTWNLLHQRNEGLQKSLAKDKELLEKRRYSVIMSERYRCSEELLARALKTIPLGSQTFSKSKTQYPYGVSPYFLQRAKGSRVWDVDGNEYLDFINSLAAVTLGYGDPDVTAAVKEQLERGVIFSLPHPLEIQVAEKIVEMVPCAEMVRYGKNGSDATAGAIRLARAYTGRDHVAVCGYHGWQDWYIGSTTRNLGVPVSTRELTHTFAYNDLESLAAIFKQYPGAVAAVILEPMNVFEPAPGFLEELRALTHKNGAVLVFDETITGFRYSNGGAQELFGVTPDLATFGKGLANGYPLSAVAGKAEIMRLMEEIFFSFTFGGEALSLAASLAVMTKMQREPVVATLRSTGTKIITGLSALIVKHGVEHIASVAGQSGVVVLPHQGRRAVQAARDQDALPAGDVRARHPYAGGAQYQLRALRRGCRAVAAGLRRRASAPQGRGGQRAPA